jgi:hypothetical protein
MAEVLELIAQIAVNLVDHPEAVRVRKAAKHGFEVYQVQVHPEDLGKVIGKGGQTARAIRTLLLAVGARSQRRLHLEIVE